MEFAVNDRKRPVGEELDYQLATRYFASALNTSNDCPLWTSQSLLKDIAKRISEQLSAVAPPKEQNGLG
jgi:hypothetical protein